MPKRPAKRTAGIAFEEAVMEAQVKARGGVVEPPTAVIARPLVRRTHEAVARATEMLARAALAPTLDLDEWARWQMADNLAGLRARIVEVERRLAGVTDTRNTGTPADVTDTRNCEVCGRVLTTVRADARFCSSRCRQRAYRVRDRA